MGGGDGYTDSLHSNNSRTFVFSKDWCVSHAYWLVRLLHAIVYEKLMDLC